MSGIRKRKSLRQAQQTLCLLKASWSTWGFLIFSIRPNRAIDSRSAKEQFIDLFDKT